MKGILTIDEVWDEIARKDEKAGLTIRVADKVIEIINKLVKTRKDKNISQRQLAQKSGIKQPALARTEKLETIPKLNTLIRIADSLGLSLEISNKNNKWDKLKGWANGMKQSIINVDGCDDLMWCEELYDGLLGKMQELEMEENNEHM